MHYIYTANPLGGCTVDNVDTATGFTDAVRFAGGGIVEVVVTAEGDVDFPGS